MFFRGNQNEWTFIPQNGEDDIADFVHNRTQSCHLGLAFALFFIEESQYRILRSAVHTEAGRLYRQNIDAASGVWGASLGHFQVGTTEISGLPDGWIKTKICKKLLGPFECREVSYFADQRDSRKKANSRYALEQTNLFCHLRVFLFLQKDFYLYQKLLRLGIQKTDHFYVVPDQIKNAGINKVAEDEKKLACIEQTSLDLKTLLKVLRSSTSFEELKPTLVNSLIRRIEVHNNDKSSGHCYVKVDIYFTAIGLIDIPTEDEIKSLMAKIKANPQECRLTA